MAPRGPILALRADPVSRPLALELDPAHEAQTLFANMADLWIGAGFFMVFMLHLENLGSLAFGVTGAVFGSERRGPFRRRSCYPTILSEHALITSYSASSWPGMTAHFSARSRREL